MWSGKMHKERIKSTIHVIVISSIDMELWFMEKNDII